MIRPFGRWYPAGPGLPWASVLDAAPAAPGILQVRVEVLLDYPKGRSAMCLYERTLPDEALSNYLAERGAESFRALRERRPIWIRFAPTPTPEADFQTLLTRFVERFGRLPSIVD